MPRSQTSFLDVLSGHVPRLVLTSHGRRVSEVHGLWGYLWACCRSPQIRQPQQLMGGLPNGVHTVLSRTHILLMSSVP